MQQFLRHTPLWKKLILATIVGLLALHGVALLQDATVVDWRQSAFPAATGLTFVLKLSDFIAVYRNKRDNFYLPLIVTATILGTLCFCLSIYAFSNSFTDLRQNYFFSPVKPWRNNILACFMPVYGVIMAIPTSKQ